jgi:hypothetical protein
MQGWIFEGEEYPAFLFGSAVIFQALVNLTARSGQSDATQSAISGAG